MNDFQRIGGISALIGGATYLIGFALAMTYLAPAWGLPPEQFVAFVMDNQALMISWHLLIYLVNAIFLVVLVLALHDRLKAGSPALAQVGAAFGLIWAGLVFASGMLIVNNIGILVDIYASDPAQAGRTFLALSAVEEGLGGGIELPGGLWILLVSWAAWRGNTLPKALNVLGGLVGIAGMATVIPAAGEIGGSIFGLGFIIWFFWVGIVMLRGRPDLRVAPTSGAL